MQKRVCCCQIATLWRKEMERCPHKGHESDWWVKGRLGGATRHDRNIKRPLLMRPNLRSANGVNMLGPRWSESMDQEHARAREKVRLGGVMIYLDLLHQLKSSSPGHRKQIRKI